MGFRRFNLCYVAAHKRRTPLVNATFGSNMKCAAGIGHSARLFGQSIGNMTAAKMMTIFIVLPVACAHAIVIVIVTLPPELNPY